MAEPSDAPGWPLSVLDRLIAPNEPDPQDAGGGGLRASERRFREALRRDLEALLNARRRFLSWPERLSALDTSLISYGARDFTTDGRPTLESRERFRAEIEQVIRQGEPRLSGVRVELADSDAAVSQTLRFRIVAQVGVSAQGGALVFDTAVEPIERKVRIVA
ncbi:MAG: type VI secretion system baseplate subunit TssE [Maricaulaceae bacterium]